MACSKDSPGGTLQRLDDEEGNGGKRLNLCALRLFFSLGDKIPG